MGGYILEAADFTPEDVSPEMVMVNLYKDGELIATRAMESGDNFSIDDEVMVRAEEIRRRDYSLDESTEPRATVVLLLRAIPELQVRVVTDGDTYKAGDWAKLEIEVENVGMIEAEEVVVGVTSDPDIFHSKYSESILDPGEAWDEDPDTEEIEPIEERFKVPSVFGPEEVFFRAHARYLDSEGGAHDSWGGTSIDIFGPLKVNKYTEDSMKFEEKSFVHLSVSNGGNRTLEVDVTDSAGQNFRAGSPLKWKMTIPPGGAETASYSVTAKKPGEGQTLPPAEAVYTIDGREYKVTSTSPVLDVIGPLVEVKKTISSSKVETGGEVTVNLTAENVGNRRTKASVKEMIPSWARFVSGETEFSRLLLPGDTVSLEYTISCPEEGSFEIPPTSVCYRDEDGTACTLESSRLRIKVEDEEIAETAANETDEAAPLASEENGTEENEDQGAGGKDDDAGGDGENPGGESILWAVPVLILIIFLAFDRYL